MSVLNRWLRRQPQRHITEHSHPQLRRRIKELEIEQAALHELLHSRVEELAAGLDEQQRLSVRVAELTDMVTELIAAAARANDAEFAEVLDRYSASL